MPVHDQSLRLTGYFEAIGRIIGHCALHGGPALHGLSPAVKYYLSNPTVDLFETPPPLSVHDIPDIDLRQLITEVSPIDSYPVVTFLTTSYRCKVKANQ